MPNAIINTVSSERSTHGMFPLSLSLFIARRALQCARHFFSEKCPECDKPASIGSQDEPSSGRMVGGVLRVVVDFCVWPQTELSSNRGRGQTQKLLACLRRFMRKVSLECTKDAHSAGATLLMLTILNGVDCLVGNGFALALIAIVYALVGYRGLMVMPYSGVHLCAYVGRNADDWCRHFRH